MNKEFNITIKTWIIGEEFKNDTEASKNHEDMNEVVKDILELLYRRKIRNSEELAQSQTWDAPSYKKRDLKDDIY